MVKVKGITVELNGDVTGIEKALRRMVGSEGNHIPV